MRRAIPYSPVWLMAMFWFLLTGAILWLGLSTAYTNRLFAIHGTPVRGTVVRKFITESHGRGGTRYTDHITYSYRAGNLAGERDVVAHGRAWWLYDQGGAISIKYLPEDPRDSRIDDADEDHWFFTTAWVASGAGLASLCAGGVLLAGAVRRNRIQRQLMNTGVCCSGTITAVETENPTGKAVRTYLVFEFTDNLGKVVEGRTWDLNRKQELLWNRHDPIQVYYDSGRSDLFTVELERSALQANGFA